MYGFTASCGRVPAATVCFDSSNTVTATLSCCADTMCGSVGLLYGTPHPVAIKPNWIRSTHDKKMGRSRMLPSTALTQAHT